MGLAVSALAYQWPASPRAVIECDNTPWHLAFSPDGSKLAILDRVAGWDEIGQVLLRDAATGAELRRLDLGKRNYPHKVVFAPDGKTLGVVDAGAITKWDVATGRFVALYDHAAWSHDPDKSCGELLFSKGGRWLYHDLYEGRVYDAEDGHLVTDHAKTWPVRNYRAFDGVFAAVAEGDAATIGL